MGEGIIGHYDTHTISTMFQIMREPHGKTWLIVQQSGAIGLPNQRSITFNYLRGIDPDTQTITLPSGVLRGQRLSAKELQEALKGLTGSKIIAPPKDVKVIPTGIPISLTSLNYINAINQNNNYGINKVNEQLIKLRDYYSSITKTINLLEIPFSKEKLSNMSNVLGLQRIQIQQLGIKEELLKRLRSEQRLAELQKFINLEKISIA